MKKIFVSLLIAPVVVFAGVTTSFEIGNQQLPQGYYKNLWSRHETGVITEKKTAIAIGVAVAREIYGDERVDRFLPYDATEEEYEGNKVWLVKGKPDVYAVGWYQVDGPIIRVRKYDGTILSVMFMH